MASGVGQNVNAFSFRSIDYREPSSASSNTYKYTRFTRGKSRRVVQLADLMLIDLENEGPKPDDSTPCMIMTMR